MIAGAVPLLHQCQFPGRKQAAAEAALHIVPVLRLPLVGAETGTQGVGGPHDAVLPRYAGAADSQIVGADHLRGKQFGQQRGPLIPEMQGKGRFCVGGAVELQVLPERRQDSIFQCFSIHGARTSQSLRSGAFCPSTDFHRAD